MIINFCSITTMLLNNIFDSYNLMKAERCVIGKQACANILIFIRLFLDFSSSRLRLLIACEFFKTREKINFQINYLLLITKHYRWWQTPKPITIIVYRSLCWNVGLIKYICCIVLKLRVISAIKAVHVMKFTISLGHN